MILKSVYAFFATFGFGILFNIKGKKLIFASVGGFITWYLYLLTLNYTNSNLLALFYASLGAGFYSEVLARLLKSPVTTFSICSIIPLVPGGGMYYTMLETVQGNVNKALTTGLDTISSAGAIAIGILLASSITKVILFFHRKTYKKVNN
jgi:uncharacterized membrane protein YjjB (DUF3815 family)